MQPQQVFICFVVEQGPYIVLRNPFDGGRFLNFYETRELDPELLQFALCLTLVSFPRDGTFGDQSCRAQCNIC